MITSYSLSYEQGSHYHSALLPAWPYLSQTSSLYSYFICCYSFFPLALAISSLKITNRPYAPSSIRPFGLPSPNFYRKIDDLLKGLLSPQIYNSAAATGLDTGSQKPLFLKSVYRASHQRPALKNCQTFLYTLCLKKVPTFKLLVTVKS